MDDEDILGEDFFGDQESDLQKRRDFYCTYKRLRRFGESDFKKIMPVWATGSLLGLNKFNRPDQYNNYVHVYVKTIDLMRKVNFGELNPDVLFSGKSHSISRYITTLHRWENGLAVDPPDLRTSLHEGSKRLEITDGRHRVILSHHIGVDCIPVCVDKFTFESISSYIELCDGDEIF